MKYQEKKYECVACKRQQYTNNKCYACKGKVFEDLLKPEIVEPKIVAPLPVKKEGTHVMDKHELIQQAFNAINNFKRHRALMEIKLYQEKPYHELQMYKMIDQLELALRAINKDIRETENVGA